MADGRERVVKAGEFFYVPPNHDSWVIGDEPYVSLHIMGSEGYADRSSTALLRCAAPGHAESGTSAEL